MFWTQFVQIVYYDVWNAKWDELKSAESMVLMEGWSVYKASKFYKVLFNSLNSILLHLLSLMRRIIGTLTNLISFLHPGNARIRFHKLAFNKVAENGHKNPVLLEECIVALGLMVCLQR